MMRGIIIALLIVIATLLVFEFHEEYAGAQTGGDIGPVLENQKLILGKLNTIDKKLDVIRIRISR